MKYRTPRTHPAAEDGQMVGRSFSTPLRVSLAGGGTDLADFAAIEGGRVIGFAINHRVAVEVDFAPELQNYELELLEYETEKRLDEISNAFAREVIRRHGFSRYVRMRSSATIAAGSGLGSSAAYTLASIAALTGRVGDSRTLIEECAVIEEAVHGRRLGLQDQAISVTGGFVDLRVDSSGFEVESIPVSDNTVRLLENSLLVMHTGSTRSSGEALNAQMTTAPDANERRAAHLATIKELADPAREALERGEVWVLGELLRAHWDTKMYLDETAVAYRELIEVGLSAGAIGGKVSGAGSGGTVVFIVDPPQRAKVRAEMEVRGLTYIDVRPSRRGLDLSMALE